MTELLDRDEYLSAGVHLGMREKTEKMEPFIFKTRPDGLSIIDIKKTDERIDVASSFLARFDEILVAGRKENCEEIIEKFSDIVGAKPVTNRFTPGMLTNPNLDVFYEPDVVLVVDPLIDKQAIKEAVNKRVPIVAICDTFNDLDYIDLVIPANNKGRKSIGVIFYLIAREISKRRDEISDNEEFDYQLEDFVGEEE